MHRKTFQRDLWREKIIELSVYAKLDRTLFECPDNIFIDAEQNLHMNFRMGKANLAVMKGHMSEDELINAVKQLETQLTWLHTNGIMHGDIKLENVMVFPEGKVCLIDFGLSIFVQHFTVMHNPKFFATITHRPPELLLSQNEVEPIKPSADVFSFGVMLLQLFAEYTDIYDVKRQSDPRYLYELWSHFQMPKTSTSNKLATFLAPKIRACLQMNPKRRPIFQDEKLQLVTSTLSEPQDFEHNLALRRDTSMKYLNKLTWPEPKEQHIEAVMDIYSTLGARLRPDNPHVEFALLTIATTIISPHYDCKSLWKNEHTYPGFIPTVHDCFQKLHYDLYQHEMTVRYEGEEDEDD